MEVGIKEIFTWPNGISAAGFGMAVKGVQKGLDTPEGAALVFAGRVFDLLDGYVARKTGQSSDLGAGIDAVLDKLGVSLIIVDEVRRDILPKPVAAAIFAQNAANALLTAGTGKKNPEISLVPTREGKYSMFGVNASLGFFSLSAIAKSQAEIIEEQLTGNFDLSQEDVSMLEEGLEFMNQAAENTRNAAWASAAVSLGYYGVKATGSYYRRYQTA